jgi:hypothetical protein
MTTVGRTTIEQAKNLEDRFSSGNWTSPEIVAELARSYQEVCAERDALRARVKELEAALELVWSMFEDKRIVRNIENDHSPDWAMRMLTFTKDLQQIDAAREGSEGK